MNQSTQGILGLLFLVILIVMCILTFSPQTIPMSRMQNGLALVVLGIMGLSISYIMKRNRKNRDGGMK